MDVNKLTPIRYKKTKRNPSECRICGDKALYLYYGVISCHSCKVFFRRNAFKDLKCHFDGHCQVNELSRHMCGSCRLNKCLQVGMLVEMIRRPRVKPFRIAKLPTLTLLDNDVSSLSDKQWICLRNLTNAYDQTAIFFVMNGRRSSTNRSPAFVHMLLASFYEVAGNYLRLNADIHQLPSNDRSILLRTAADNITCLGAVFILHQTHLFHDEVLWNDMYAMYGKRTMDYHRWSRRFTPSDVIIFKLAVTLFALSTNARVLHWNMSTEYDHPKEILTIENQYAELIWKYFVYKYGHEQSVRICLRMAQWFLAATVLSWYGHDSHYRMNDLNSLIEQTEVALILDDVDRIFSTCSCWIGVSGLVGRHPHPQNPR